MINVASQTEQTWKQIEVESHTESVGNLWKDGKPTDNHRDEIGDKTVLYSSAVLPGTQVINANGNHSEIIKDASDEIFDELGIPYQAPFDPVESIKEIWTWLCFLKGFF